MSILRKLGATTTAVAVLGAGVLTAATTAQAAAPAAKTVAAPKVAPKTVVTTAKAKPKAKKTVIVPGRRHVALQCMSGRYLCINKKTRKVMFFVNGKLIAEGDARFGAARTPTKNGTFKVYRKSKNHVSSIYHSPMPYAMFFVGGQAVHYSSDFKARGYNGASHGCVNMRDKKKIALIFSKVKIGDKVLVYSA
ncbi:L,D-transpeptidase [Streptomyces sp. SID13031]|uniref:L,D-transpeptidase n=1 Tax=Streptomyces sp. SID13031 TaxID=2706046 RepID=UPI0013CB58D9|nr:L,D-transpeptidase [Streptomyces sp. SID13031]NEA31839.1 L,D-transpeptidase [Streptomyces sp. SID13031]